MILYVIITPDLMKGGGNMKEIPLYLFLIGMAQLCLCIMLSVAYCFTDLSHVQIVAKVSLLAVQSVLALIASIAASLLK